MKKFLLFTMAVTLFAACSVDMSVDVATQPVDVPEELYVSFDEEDTRIQLGEAGQPVWTKGDLVSVFYRSNANSKYQFTGETGESIGAIELVEKGVATPTQQTTQIVAVYPYSEDYWFNWNTGDVEAFLPAEQTYLKDSFGIGSSIMVSQSNYKQLSFKNVCGWIKLQFTGNQIVETIAFKGNNGEQVAGEIYINTSDASCELASGMGFGEDVVKDEEKDDLSRGVGGFINEDGNIITEVTLNCGEGGVQLDKTTPTAFYIALPPQTFEKGFSVTLTCQDNTTKTLSTSNAITIERNHILPMGAIKVEMEVPDGNATFAANTITWNYTDDAEQDANLYDDSDETVAVYSRDIELSVDENKLPNGVTIDKLIKSDDLQSVTVNGEVVLEGVALSVNSEGKYILHIDDFDWNTTYEIEFAYENLDEHKGDKYAATLSTTVTTVGRSNDPIKLSDETTVMYADNLLFDPFTENAPKVDLKQIYSIISAAYDISNFADADAFIAKMFITDENEELQYKLDDSIVLHYVIGNHITITENIEDLWDFNESYSEMSVKYDGTRFEGIPSRVEYNRIIKLQYGQEIKITMIVNVKQSTYYFKHNDDLVSQTDGVWSSTITPTFIPSTTSDMVTGYDVSIDLMKAFSIVDETGTILTEEGLKENNLRVEFCIEDDICGQAYIENNKLYYYHTCGSQLNIKGQLYKTNSNGDGETLLNSNFDKNNTSAGYENYTNYVVKITNFAPIYQIEKKPGALIKKDVPIGEKGVHYIDLLEFVTLFDWRGTGHTRYNLIDSDSHKLIIGNGINGYGEGVKVEDLYKISITAEWEDTPSDILYLSIDNSDNFPRIKLDIDSLENGMQKDYTGSFTLIVTTPWETETFTSKFIFGKVIQQ